MRRNYLHNLLVQAFAAGVEKAMEPLPKGIDFSSPEAAKTVGVMLGGAARKHAENVCLLPGVSAQLED